MSVVRPYTSSTARLLGLPDNVAAAEATVAGSVVVWIVGAVTVLVLIALSAVKLVAAHQRLVVFRFGRVVAVKDSGVRVVLPWLHRVVRVPSGPVRVDLWWVEAPSRDGVVVSVNGSLLAHVRDPVRYALHPTSARASTERAAEELVRDYIGSRALSELVHPDATALHELAAVINDRTGQWGVEVADIELSQMDVAVRAELLRWARAMGTRRTRAPALLGSPLNADGEVSTMDVTRTTVPRTGTLHHFVTRGGQQFGLLVEGSNDRRLFVYGSADLDVPAQTIVLEQDEADQLAEMLQSQSVADRLTALEHRFAEVAGEAR